MISRIEDLQKIISDSQAEIQTIQNTCEHTHYLLGYWSYRVGNLSPARICNDCGLLLKLCPYGSKEYEYVVINQGKFKGSPFENIESIKN